jgi:hypothetical protein
MYEARTAEGIALAQIPFVRRWGRPALNMLGDDIVAPVSSRFFGSATTDKVVEVLSRKGAWPSIPNRNWISPRAERAMDDDEYWLYVKNSGERIRAWADARLDTLEVQEMVNRAAEKIREQERAKLGF